jgi:tetratricopeptide (TPR) repeat protein
MKRIRLLLGFLALAAWLLSPTRLCETWEQALESDARSLSRAAAEAKAAGKFEKALELYSLALAQNPAWSEGWESLGILLADRKEYVRAREAFENLVRLQPKSGDAWTLLGLCEFRMGQYDLAVGHLEKARTFDIANKTLLRLLYYYSAAVMILRGDFDTAQIRLLLLAREGVASDELMEAYGLAALRVASLPGQEPPELRTVVLEVGRLVANAPHLSVKEATVGFERLTAKYASQPGLRYAYGKYLAYHALYTEACEAFKQELSNSPQDAMARLQIATIQSQQLNRPAEALPVAEEAVELAPRLFASHFVLGRILLKLGETDRAVRELETAAQQAPDSVTVHTMLLHAYNKAKRKEDAAREQEVLRRLQEFEAAIKGETSSHATEALPQGNSEPPESGPQ